MNLLGVFFKGFAMGAANVVPGVSGGTVAFITGIYERLINALKSFDLSAVKLLLRFKIRDFIDYVDFWFLATLGLGVVTSVFTLAKALDWGFTHYPEYVASLFFGLIIASIPSLAKMVRSWSASRAVFLVLGLIAAVLLAYAPTASENSHVIYLMLCGVVAMCSMIIPGVSGSFVLLLMGNYQLIMIHSVNQLREGNLEESLPVILPVGVGAVLGLITLSHLLSWLFKRHHDCAVSVIAGFVTGSLVIVWPWKRPEEVVIKGDEEKVLSYASYFPEMDGKFAIAVAIMLLGAGLMLMTEKLGSSKP
ncbi:DUF368 domain-containing protein [Rubritalea marina]|uniref:DUF368 domain-containing protein n=1 Tax=Rubritalea marina TaxID=361055 RepID=UPI00039CBB47|nr:DUF368 domain-containing protein [Rubritalea marina]